MSKLNISTYATFKNIYVVCWRRLKPIDVFLEKNYRFLKLKINQKTAST